MSSRKLEDGTVEITAPVYSTMPVGYRLRVCGLDGGGWRLDELLRGFADYEARLALSSASNGRPRGEGVTVQPDDSALFELIEDRLVHESLVEEPRAA